MTNTSVYFVIFADFVHVLHNINLLEDAIISVLKSSMLGNQLMQHNIHLENPHEGTVVVCLLTPPVFSLCWCNPIHEQFYRMLLTGQKI